MIEEVNEYLKKYTAMMITMNAELDALLRKVQTGESQIVYYPLTDDTQKFKGKKPSELILSSG